jgi:FeS assembly SUF system regulator
MLRLSKLADYGTVIMVHLAQYFPQQLSAKDIASAVHVPLPTVAKLLKLLTNHGFLVSTLGAKGGYTLAREAKDIALTQIIHAVEGDTGLTECSTHEGECQIEAVCQIRGNWQHINQVVTEALSRISLATLAKPVVTEITVPLDNNLLKKRNEQ